MGRLRRTTMPLRRWLARMALVDEARDRTREDIQRLRDEVVAADAKLDEDLHRLSEEIDRLSRDTSALFRVVSEPSPETEPATAEATPASNTNRTFSREGLFQELERGSRSEVMSKIAGYLEWFDGREPIVDLGCGRGEFLELAQRRGLKAYGVDSDAAAVERCVAIGLDARREDLFDHLHGLASESVGGVFCSQVVEHIPPDLLGPLLREIARVLRPGGVAVIETPNPATFATHAHSFWRDPTHLRPVPEPALSFAAKTAGLSVERVVYASPVADDERLRPVDLEVDADGSPPELAAVVETLNDTTRRLNDLLFGYQDYAVVAVKPE